MKSIWIVTHGPKGKGVNPGLTEGGFTEIGLLRSLVPLTPPMVVIGKGKRYDDTLQALDLLPLPSAITANPVAGVPDSLERVDGQEVVILENGDHVPLEDYKDGASLEDVLALILSLEDDSVICGGRPIMIALGVKDAKSAIAYRVTVIEGKVFRISAHSFQGAEIVLQN